MFDAAKTFRCIIVMLLAVEICFANRAFPVPTQNFVEDLFQRINPNIEWDPTNFLVDLAGHYTSCEIVGTRGPFSTTSKYAEGKTIGGLKDFHAGEKHYGEDVHEYLMAGLKSWISDPLMTPQIRKADRFGCSVRPLCSGYVTFACLFSPAASSIDPNDVLVEPNAQAFTPEQYSLAEDITRQFWDRAHTLENLSGVDADCSMIDNRASHIHARKYAEYHNMKLDYAYGSAENKGETEPALKQILHELTPVFLKINPVKIGCSLIPDCMVGGQMFVVVNCVLS